MRTQISLVVTGVERPSVEDPIVEDALDDEDDDFVAIRLNDEVSLIGSFDDVEQMLEYTLGQMRRWKEAR